MVAKKQPRERLEPAQFTLRPDQVERLNELARKTRLPKSVLVRDAIDAWTWRDGE